MKRLEDTHFCSAIDAYGTHKDALKLITDIFAFIRPVRCDDADYATSAYALLLETMEHDPLRRKQMSIAVGELISSRRLVGFFSDSGILPATGFFSELMRIIAHRLLPEIPDTSEFRDCVQIIFNRQDDWIWLSAIPPEQSQRFWHLILAEGDIDPDAGPVLAQLLEAILVLAYRISGFDMDREFRRLGESVVGHSAAFRSVAGEAQRYTDALRKAQETGQACAEDGRHLMVLIDQCKKVLERAHRAAMKVGTSLALTFSLRRAAQSLQRLEVLTVFLAESATDVGRVSALQGWAILVRDAVRAEAQRNNIAQHVSRGMSFLALRITDNAAKSGEHYITETRAAYFHMWRSAMGAGVIIAIMALIKIFTAKLTLAPFGYAFLYSMIYGLGFVLIYMLHMTVATKQPAMTAQTIAGYLGLADDGKLANIERVVDLIAAVVRSQIAAILGNVAIALPTAMLIGFVWQTFFGSPMLEISKGAHLLGDLNPLGWALPHAALAGVFLFFSGIISGYFDNLASYARMGVRISRLGWLNRLFGAERANKTGVYIEENLGGIFGNFLFGCMLGSAGTLGLIFGLPIDIRHIAFASANLGYAISAFSYSILFVTVAWAALGVALIGFVNLTVSFVLALWMALRARNITFSQTPELLRRLWYRFRTDTRSFFYAPREGVEDVQDSPPP